MYKSIVYLTTSFVLFSITDDYSHGCVRPLASAQMMLNVGLYPAFKLFWEEQRAEWKTTREEVTGERNGYVWKWLNTSAPGGSTNPSGDWLQEEWVSVCHAHAYSILFLHKWWSVTSSQLPLGCRGWAGAWKHRIPPGWSTAAIFTPMRLCKSVDAHVEGHTGPNQFCRTFALHLSIGWCISVQWDS